MTPLEKIKSEDKCRDFKWFKELFETDRLKIAGDNFTKGTFDLFRKMIKTTEDIHPDMWDIDVSHYDTVGGQHIFSVEGIIIYFPEFVMTNSNGESHTITDLFVKIPISKNGSNIYINGLLGTRTKVTYAEWTSGYFHSHLPGGYTKDSPSISAPNWKSFCTGSGHINEFMADINSEGVTIERFQSFLIQIISMVTWESLEGGPHRLIRNITLKPSNGRSFSYNSSMVDELYTNIIEEYTRFKRVPDIDLKYQNNRYHVIDNGKVEQIIKDFTEALPDSDNTKRSIWAVHDPATGNNYRIGDTPGFQSPPITRQRNKFFFKGVEFEAKVEAPPADLIENLNTIIYPPAIQHLTKKLENDINIKTIRKSTVDRYKSKDGNAIPSTESNQVPVQENISS